MLAGRPDPQSYLALRLLYEAEKDFPDTSVYVYEFHSERETTCLESLAKKLGIRYTQVRLSSPSYTCYKLSVMKAVSGLGNPLVVLPLTIEDIAEYLLSEALTGMLEGMLLDARMRVAYPLVSRSLKELNITCGCTPRTYINLKGLGVKDVRSVKAFYEALIARLPGASPRKV